MQSTAQPVPAVDAASDVGLGFLRRSLYAVACVAMDAGLLLAALLVALGVRHLLSRLIPLQPLSILRFPEPGMLYALGVGITLAGLAHEGMYSTGLAMLDRTERMVRSLSWSLFLLILVSFTVHKSADVSRLFIFLCYIALFSLMVLLRPAWERRLVRAFKIHPDLVLVGGAELPADTRRLLGDLGFDLRSGDFPPRESVSARTSAFVAMRSDLAVGSLAELEVCYQELGIIALGTEVSPMGSQPVNLRGAQIFVISHPLRRWLNRFVKRGIDIVGASALLLASLPAWLAIAIWIRLESPGPVLFAQSRLGRGSRPFVIYKFRSMVVDAERRLETVLADDPEARREYLETGKLKKDPRVTRSGRWLRRYSLDEIPQFWNVLVGDMSLVGPRPICLNHERELFGSAYEIISSVRPGLTGIWQTSGRSDTSYHSRRDFDVYYVRCWSLWLDLALLVKTLQAVLMPGAY